MNRKQRRAAKKSGGGFDDRMTRAMSLHQAGRLMEADALYRAILQERPADADALRLRGALAYQIGNPQAASELLSAARQAAPKNVEVLSLLGLALEGAGNPGAAERAYREAAAIEPGNATIWNNLGALLRETGRADAAEESFRKALSLKPNYPDAQQNLAVTLFRLGRMDESLALFATALSARPDDPELLLNHGVVLNAADRPAEAVACFKDALAAAPDDPDILSSLAAAYLKLEDLEQAETAARAACKAAPDSPGAAANLAMVLSAARRFDEAEPMYHDALRGAPDFADIWSNYGNMLVAADRLEEAEIAYRKAREKAPDDPRHTFQMGLCHLAAGRLDSGWDLYEAGLECGERVPAILPDAPRWDGGALPGGRLLIVPEQGLGDEIRNLSCLPDILNNAGSATVTVGIDARLEPLVRQAFPNIETVSRNDLADAAPDMWCPAASLPALFRRNLAQFPERAGYLRADAGRMAEYRRQLGDGPVVGLAWRSGLKRLRSRAALSEIDDWRPVLELPGLTIVNLQYGDVAEELSGQSVTQIDGLNLRDDLSGAAALTAACDLVINMGTSVGDMAGALGVPCWSLLLKPDWIALGSGRHPFYPKTEVFWRPPDEAWATVIRRVADRLKSHPWA